MSAGVSTVESIRSRLRTATARDMEQFAGVSYTELLDAFPLDRVLDSQALNAILSANAGAGTPLGASEFGPLNGSAGTIANFNVGLMGFFQTCGVSLKRDESPHSISIGESASRLGSRRS